ncbi:MAG: hypothetical protein NTY02_00195 [Acidobacteria bacterium]|nr:hypothetical protein [Acidobacteriota bacterium]
MAKKAAKTATLSKAARRRLPLRVQVQQDVDKALAQAGIPSAVDKDGWRWLKDPSADGLIGVVAVVGQREELSLRVVAPILPLPKEPAKLLRLLRKIAETNYDIPGHSRLAIDSRTVWSVVAQNVGDIGPDDVPNCIFDCLWLAQATAEGLKGEKRKITKRR